MKPTESKKQLVITRSIRAPQEILYDALTIPEKMNRWFYGMEKGSAKVTGEVKVGGKYVVEMFEEDGEPENCGGDSPHGEYLELDRPNKIVFTWIAPSFLDYSVVTIELKPDAVGTELTLTHELPEDMVGCHQEGWNNCLDHLEALFA